KGKSFHVCEACGARQPKWQGQCPDCGAWNSIVESAAPDRRAARAERAQYSGRVELARLNTLEAARIERLESGLGELDRVLGGGLVPGSVVLIGGDPGIGKSTLLLAAVANLAVSRSVCYVTGEESLDQIALRARRMGVGEAPVQLLAETCVEAVLAQIEAAPPDVLVIDSIQTLYSDALESAPGSVTQLREARKSVE